MFHARATLAAVTTQETPSAAPSCVACFLRRDSRIEVWTSGEETWVRKTYHATFDAAWEAEAYRVLRAVVYGIRRVRAATVYRVLREENALELEFVRGPTLARDVIVRRLLAKPHIRRPLLELLVRTQRLGAQVDLDPQNIIVEEGSGHLVLIDPVLRRDELFDSPAIFFLGLVKCFFRRIYSLGNWLPFMRAWIHLKSDYLQRSGTSDAAFCTQMADHIDRVIRWNSECYSTEGPLLRSWRLAVLVPTWSLIAACFRWRAAGMRKRAVAVSD